MFLVDCILSVDVNLINIEQKSLFYKNWQESEKILLKNLNEEQKKLYLSVRHDFIMHAENLICKSGKKFLHYGIEIGKEISENYEKLFNV